MKLLLCGCMGHMGQVITAAVEKDDTMEIVAGIDKVSGAAYPVFANFSDVDVRADVIVDFSHPSVLDDLLSYAKRTATPVVIATTGYSSEQIEKIKEASKTIPVFFTFNLSVGINLLASLTKKAAKILGQDFDIEIVEKHHNQKLDAPSGTAILLANAANSVFDDTLQYAYDRHSKREKRTKNEIGIHSVRGGTIVGEHEVIFAGHDEVITLSHSAQSKEVFAMGSLRAAKFLSGKPKGLYDMNDVLCFD